MLGSFFVSTAFASLSVALITKRQDANDTVGTNLYNCHDNCGWSYFSLNPHICIVKAEVDVSQSGEAILEEEIAGFCGSTIFSTDYAACLQCSGPDNEDIWQYYGPYLTAGAVECGSSTVPLSGTQADVATALPAQNASTPASTASATVAGTSSISGSSAITSTSSTSSTSIVSVCILVLQKWQQHC
jgi:hypothetical protein